MTCSLLAHGLSMTCLWLVHDLFTTCSYLVHSFHCLVLNLFTICQWLICDLFTTCVRLVCDLFITCLWQEICSFWLYGPNTTKRQQRFICLMIIVTPHHTTTTQNINIYPCNIISSSDAALALTFLQNCWQVLILLVRFVQQWFSLDFWTEKLIWKKNIFGPVCPVLKVALANKK